MASAVDSRLAYARLSAVATASRLPTANRGSNNSYTTSWDTTYLLHVAGHNLSLLMRQLIGAGTPREAVAGGYGGIFVLLTPTGAMLVARGVSQSGRTAFAAAFLIWE